MLAIHAKTFLQERGFNLHAVLDCGELPADIQEQLAAENLAIANYPRLVLLGTSGSQIWERLHPVWIKRENPFDEYSVEVARQFIQEHLDGAPSKLFYPGPARISLIRLGELAGWSHPSPLGLGIHPEYGLWFAYRAAFVTSAPLAPTVPTASEHPCESCTEKPCIAACPVGAVSAVEEFDISGCYHFRISHNSPCASQCFSRFACPVGALHSYPLEQVAHHYDLGRRVG